MNPHKMLNKILGNKTLHNLSSHNIFSHARAPENHAEKRSRALKIIHVGGLAECYYMAVPAARIIDKYPKFILARPEIFRRPWDSIVGPEEILVPGQRYYVVPRQTVKKLSRRIRKPATKSLLDHSGNFANCSVISTSSIMVKPGTKDKAKSSRHVKFLDVENKKKESSSSRTEKMVRYDQKKGGNNNFTKEKGELRNVEVHEKRRTRDRFEYSWEPSLNAIDEKY